MVRVPHSSDKDRADLRVREMREACFSKVVFKKRKKGIKYFFHVYLAVSLWDIRGDPVFPLLALGKLSLSPSPLCALHLVGSCEDIPSFCKTASTSFMSVLKTQLCLLQGK